MRDLDHIASALSAPDPEPTTAPIPLRRRPGPRPGAKPKAFRLAVIGSSHAPAPGDAEVRAILGLAEDLARQHLFPGRIEP